VLHAVSGAAEAVDLTTKTSLPARNDDDVDSTTRPYNYATAARDLRQGKNNWRCLLAVFYVLRWTAAHIKRKYTETGHFMLCVSESLPGVRSSVRPTL